MSKNVVQGSKFKVQGLRFKVTTKFFSHAEVMSAPQYPLQILKGCPAQPDGVVYIKMNLAKAIYLCFFLCRQLKLTAIYS